MYCAIYENDGDKGQPGDEVTPRCWDRPNHGATGVTWLLKEATRRDSRDSARRRGGGDSNR